MQTFGCFFAKNRIYSINFIYETGMSGACPFTVQSRSHLVRITDIYVPSFLPLIPLHSNSSVSAEMRFFIELYARKSKIFGC